MDQKPLKRWWKRQRLRTSFWQLHRFINHQRGYIFMCMYISIHSFSYFLIFYCVFFHIFWFNNNIMLWTFQMKSQITPNINDNQLKDINNICNKNVIIRKHLINFFVFQLSAFHQNRLTRNICMKMWANGWKMSQKALDTYIS